MAFPIPKISVIAGTYVLQSSKQHRKRHYMSPRMKSASRNPPNIWILKKLPKSRFFYQRISFRSFSAVSRSFHLIFLLLESSFAKVSFWYRFFCCMLPTNIPKLADYLKKIWKYKFLPLSVSWFWTCNKIKTKETHEIIHQKNIELIGLNFIIFNLFKSTLVYL